MPKRSGIKIDNTYARINIVQYFGNKSFSFKNVDFINIIMEAKEINISPIGIGTGEPGNLINKGKKITKPRIKKVVLS